MKAIIRKLIINKANKQISINLSKKKMKLPKDKFPCGIKINDWEWI